MPRSKPRRFRLPRVWCLVDRDGAVVVTASKTRADRMRRSGLWRRAR